MDGGCICICTSGEADISIDTKRHRLTKGCELILMDESVLFIRGSSDDFKVSTFLYTKQLALQAMHKIDPSLFNHIIKRPIYKYKGGGEATIVSYINILESLQNDHNNRFGVSIATNLLRCIFLNIYDKVLRFQNISHVTTATRKEDIFIRFVSLIGKHARSHRDVGFYAKELYITPRYLGDITKEVASKSPKEVIDSHIISEIKLMLTFSDMTIQQIADYLHFPDQSYFGRYFKHFTGLSPVAYRKKEIKI